MRLMRTIGVWPTASRMVSQTFFTTQVYTGPHAEAHRRANRDRRSRDEAEEDRRIHRPRQFGARAGQRGENDLAVRLARAGTTSRVRRDHRGAERDGPR